MARALAVAAILALAPLPARAEEPAPPRVVRRWLALDGVDSRGRVPFNRNAPFARYLLDRAAPPPKERETVKGDRGEKAWRAVEAAEDGTVSDSSGAWFYGVIEEPADRVALARLEGATMVFVNGAGFVGDVYRGGFGPVPVALRAGRNDLFVVGPRGPWRLALESVDPAPQVRGEDGTVNDIVQGLERQSVLAGVKVINPTLEWRDPPLPGIPPLPPLGAGKSGVELPFPEETRTVRTAQVPIGAGKAIAVAVVPPGAARRVTFVSSIDGSVQGYAVVPPAGAGPTGTVLSLHGAGVDALGQARCYAAKPGLRIVAPTGRRPFGFDWQDWGRVDAYEALYHSMKAPGNACERIYLTGHSMGGHGTWHLAATDPGEWAAIAPSAGWCSFSTYAGPPPPDSPLSPIWRGADGGSRTEDLVANLAPLPTFVLHGTTDDNVPVTEAQGMLARLENVGGKPRHHFQEGAGHWWDGDAGAGTDCVDWPGIFELFLHSSLPVRGLDAAPTWSMDPLEARRPPREILGPESFDWVGTDLSVARRRSWVTVHQPLRYGEPVRVRARWTEGGPEIATENLRRITIEALAGRPFPGCVIDGQPLAVPEGARFANFVREGERWGPPAPTRDERRPFEAGPFKSAFANGFVLVVGTKGTEEENRETLELARYHAQTWWYRANGNAAILRDRDLLAAFDAHANRNLVLYGNADTNAAWAAVRREGCPLEARRGEIRLGERAWKGDGLGAVFLYPRSGDRGGLVGAFAASGARGTRLGYGLLPFVSGVGYPDYAVFATAFLAEGDGGVLAAGWFDHRWALQAGGFVKEGK